MVPSSDLSNKGGYPLTNNLSGNPSGMWCCTNGQVGSDISKDRSVFIFRVVSPRCLYPWTAVPFGQNIRRYLPDGTA